MRACYGWLLLGLAVVVVAGCSAPPAPAYPTWAPPARSYAPSEGSSNAFDGYVLAARQAEDATAKWNKRVFFTPGQKKEIIAACRPALSLIRRSAAKRCDFQFSSQKPFELAPNHVGWRMIRDSLAWQIEATCVAGDFNTAVSLTVLATKVGFDLTGGSAKDADLGLQMVDDARQALAPSLPDLSAAQLQTLTEGLKNALALKPAFSQTIENEKLNMLQAVQLVQDSYRANDFATLKQQLGNDVRDAITYLNQIRREDAEKRPAYFEGFADEANKVCESMRKLAALPVSRRAAEPEPKLAESRPWRRFAKQFFGALKPALAKDDATTARTRLLILASEIYRQIKVAKQAPKTLGGFTRELTLDPYSGEPFKYRATGSEFLIYSVGGNFLDDLGETDSTFSSPDLTLETGRR